MSLRIGKIEYANCVPLFRALDSLSCNRYQFVRGVPAQLNAMLAAGEIDLSPSSSIVYGADPDRYWLLPDLSISAAGPVRSVLLFSRSPIEDLQGAVIGLTNESDTSVALLRIILERFYGFTNQFVRTGMNSQSAMQTFGALLLIGDQDMRESMNVTGNFVYDLGELWYSFTNLPFVYALWLVNRQSVAGRVDQVSDLAKMLVQAKETSRKSLASYVQGTGLEWYGSDNLIAYWRTISYDLGESQIAGVTAFFRYAADLGIIAHPPDLAFLPAAIPDRCA